MQPKIDHIQITVRDFDRAEKFYDKLMPILGFKLENKHKGEVPAHEFRVIEYVHENIVIGINSPRKNLLDERVHRRRPGALHHLAFRAASKEEVDAVFPAIENTGAEIVAPPQYYPQHGENYYALFFKDYDGIKLEIMFDGERT